MTKQYSYNSDYINRLTDGWNAISFPIISQVLLNTLRTYTPKHILDYGAGAGSYAETLAASGGVVDACDISEHAISSCSGGYTRAFQINGSSDLPSNEYDMIFSTEVIEHIKDYKAVITNFHRALRPKGVIVLTTTAYSASIFTMLYQAKNAGASLFYILQEVGLWLAGFFSAARRGQFVEKWCFEALGGHFHGFLKSGLLSEFRKAGFTVLKSAPFFALEPIQMPFLHSYTFFEILRKEEWAIVKRCVAVSMYSVLRPLNIIMKRLGLFANNFYVIAQRN